MQLLFELNFGYVSCDIHGDGYNRIWVYRDDWAPLGSEWRGVLSSRCYGDEEKTNISKDELIEFVESKRFFVATRPARRAYNRFLAGLKRGTFDVKPETARGEAPPAETTEENWVDQLVWADTQPSMYPEAVDPPTVTVDNRVYIVPAPRNPRRGYVEGEDYLRACTCNECIAIRAHLSIETAAAPVDPTYFSIEDDLF